MAKKMKHEGLTWFNQENWRSNHQEWRSILKNPRIDEGLTATHFDFTRKFGCNYSS